MTLFRLTDSVVHLVWFTWLDEDEGVGFFVGHFTGLDPFFCCNAHPELYQLQVQHSRVLLISEVSCVLLRGFVHAGVGPFCTSIIKASLEPACLFYVPQLYNTLKCSFNKSVVLCVCVSDYRFRVSVFPAFFVSHLLLLFYCSIIKPPAIFNQPESLISFVLVTTCTHTDRENAQQTTTAWVVGWLLHPPGRCPRTPDI